MEYIRLYAGDIPKTNEYKVAGIVGLSLSRSDKRHIKHDITRPMPIPDNSVDIYQAEDVFEHIEYDKHVDLINEIYRVLKPGGLFRLSVPDYRCDILRNRSVRNDNGDIVFDHGGGGKFANGKVIKGGHVWFPVYETVKALLEQSKFTQYEFLHFSYHAIRVQIIDTDSIRIMGNGLFCYPTFYRKLFLVEGVMPFGMIANAVFVLISGYFMVERGKDINLGNISLKLLLQVGYAALVLTIGSIISYKIVTPDVYTRFSILTIDEFYSMNWFVGYYFLVMVIAGAFLNGFLEKLDEKRYRNLLLTVLGLFSIGWAGGLLDALADGLRILTCGVFLYALGGYMKRFNPFARIKTWALFLLVVVLYALIYLSYYNVVQNDIHSYMMNAAVQEVNGDVVSDFIQPIYGFRNYGFVTVALSVIMVELFCRLRIPCNKLINLLGKGTFMVYLLHDNDFFRCLWMQYDWASWLSNGWLLYCVELCKWVIIVFGSGIIMYFVYLGLGSICIMCKGIFTQRTIKD